ncbi:MAG: hypothetical protein Q4P72_05965 [Eubacteriales bacterium]|nr:hypothetical protein [Eubacteriales bacterium]
MTKGSRTRTGFSARYFEIDAPLWPRLISVFLIFVFCLSISFPPLLAGSAEAGVETRSTDEKQTSPLLHQILQAISKPDKSAEIYSAFTAKIQNEVSSDELHAYCDLLHQALAGPVTAFSKLSTLEYESLRTKVLKENPAWSTILDSSQLYWIESNRGKKTRRALLALEQKSGTEVLNRAFIREILDLNSYANLYFTSIRDRNTDALANLLYSELDDKNLRRRKAEKSLAYYESKIDLEQSTTYILRPDALVIAYGLKDEASDEDGDDSAESWPTRDEHQIYFIRNGRDIFVRDPIGAGDYPELSQLEARSGRRYSIEEIFRDPEILINSEKLKAQALDLESHEDFKTIYEEGIDRFEYYSSPGISLGLSVNREGGRSLLFVSLNPTPNNVFQNPELLNLEDRAAVLERFPFADVSKYSLEVKTGIYLLFHFTEEDKTKSYAYYSEQWNRYSASFIAHLSEFESFERK